MEATRFNRLAMVAGLFALGTIFTSAWSLNSSHDVAAFAIAERAAVLPASPPVSLYTSHFASSDVDEFVHSSSISALPGGDLISVWFAGSREGAADVEVRGARYLASEGRWGKELALATRESTQSAVQKHVRKLGNPVIALAPDNRLWLFYVSVSIGGWAGSAINAMHSDDLGYTWSSPRQLVTTPFLNISTLVRTAPVFHADGSIGLPVYHEFLGKFAEYLYLSADGEVIDKFRISRGDQSLQPTVVPLDGQNAVAMLRYAGDDRPRVLASRTRDAGQTWSEPYQLEPANPNSSLAAVLTPDRRLLVALNDLTDGRFRLRLMSTDASMDVWTEVFDVDESPDPAGNPFDPDVFKEIIGDSFRLSAGAGRQVLLDGFLGNLDERVCKNSGCEFQYEYPYFAKSADGFYHLVYSWNNSFIKHVSFNDAWLEERK